MASTKEYLDFVLEQLSRLDDIENREFLRGFFDTMFDELPEAKKLNRGKPAVS